MDAFSKKTPGIQNILIVDDEHSIREILTCMLGSSGYSVTTAPDGNTALEKLAKDTFDLVITDVIMPNGSGLDLLERMRLLYPEIISIVISACDDIDPVIDAMRFGAAGFILKPIRTDELRLTIRAAAENQRLREEQSRIRILTELVDAGKEIADSLDLSVVCEKAVEYARKITQADTASLMLLDNETKEFVISGSSGLHGIYSNGYRTSSNQGIAGWALERCFSLNLSERHILSPELQQLMTRSHVIRSSICMPILCEGSPLGVINVNIFKDNGKARFDQSDMNFLSILSSHAGVCIRNSQLFNNIQTQFEGSIQALAEALHAKDNYTRGHSERVAGYAGVIAEELRLPLSEIRDIWTAGILHDLGKIGTPEKILQKPSNLDGTEWEIMQNHPVVGAQIIQSIPPLKQISGIILHHHERYDGNGYPHGIAGESIPLGARILTVADAIEAMVSSRPYRKDCTKEEVLNELNAEKGRQFDPDVVECVVRLINEEKLVFIDGTEIE